MVRPSLYDRIAQKREAAAALALQPVEPVEHDPADHPPEPPQAVRLQPDCNRITLAGLDLALPAGCQVRDLSLMVTKEALAVDVSVRLRPAPELLTLARCVASFIDDLQHRLSDVVIIRQQDTTLAGNAAIAVDYSVMTGLTRQHGRAVHSILETAGSREHQWVSVATLADAALSEWLPDFDAMLASLQPQ